MMAYGAVGAFVFFTEGTNTALWTVFALPLLGVALVSWTHGTQYSSVVAIGGRRMVVDPVCLVGWPPAGSLRHHGR